MTLTCERVDGLLAGWIEGDLDRPGHDAVAAHLRECLRCAAVVRDINAIRREAARLPELEPARDLWDGIAARIEAPVIDLASRRGPAPSRRAWSLAAAAVLLMAITSGVTYSIAIRGVNGGRTDVASQPRDSRSPDPAPPAPSNQPAVSAPTRQADRSTGDLPAAILTSAEPLAPEILYDREIDQLRTVLDGRRELLDSATIAVVEQSLRTIDQAISEARAALSRDSSSPFLHDQLNRALEKKLGVLRTAALLPAGAS